MQLRTSGKFGQPTCLFHILIIGIIKKINKGNSEDPDEAAHMEPSHLYSQFSNVGPYLPDVRNYLTLPYSLLLLSVFC